MSEPTLKEIEEFLIELWTKRAFLKDNTSHTTASGLDSNTLDPRGISVYANILRLNHQQVMTEIFPRAARLAGKHWDGMALAYLSWRLSAPVKENHFSKRFSLNHIGDAFHDFLIDDLSSPEKSPVLAKHPYLAALSQYEIIQKDLCDYSQTVPPTQTSKQLLHDFSKYGPIINPHLRIFHTNWDLSILLKLIDSIPPTTEEIEPFHISQSKMIFLAIQNSSTGNIRLLELNELTALIIKTAIATKNSYSELLSIASDHLLMPKEKLKDCGLQLFQDLKEQKVIIGDRELLRENKQ
jgi:hypothetical protein